MMDMVMANLVVLYGGIFWVVAWRLTKLIRNEGASRIESAERLWKDSVRRKDTGLVKRKAMEEEAFKIFTLYEMTREITKSLSEKQAFQIFRQRLSRHVAFEDCSWVDAHPGNALRDEQSEAELIFPLKGKDEVNGWLVLKGVKAQDREKVRILGHQFAMALRRVRLYQKIGKIAITDGLTGVHTRGYVMDRFEEEVSRCKQRGLSMSFLMIDVDHFKDLNDRYGHLTGDQALRSIGRIIRESIREIDIPGRYGGEEFCVILPETDLKGALYAAERIRKAAEQTVIRADEESFQVTLSIGIATYPEHGGGVSEIIDKADWALYRSKKRGRNMVSAFGLFQN